MIPSFEAAVEFAQSELTSEPWLTAEGARKVRLAWLRHELARRGREPLLRTLIKAAAERREAHEVLCDYAAHLIERGFPLPAPLRLYLVDLLRGVLAPPTRQQGGQRTVARDFHIVLVMYELVTQWGMRPTANEATAKESASDVVAEALRRSGIDIKSPAVAKVWARRSTLDDFESFLGLVSNE